MYSLNLAVTNTFAILNVSAFYILGCQCTQFKILVLMFYSSDFRNPFSCPAFQSRSASHVIIDWTMRGEYSGKNILHWG